MNAIVNRTEPNITILQIPKETESLIKVSVSENTLKPYQRALHNLETWLSGQTLSDALLAEYIINLHKTGKTPATIKGLPSRGNGEYIGRLTRCRDDTPDV